MGESRDILLSEVAGLKGFYCRILFIGQLAKGQTIGLGQRSVVSRTEGGESMTPEGQP